MASFQRLFHKYEIHGKHQADESGKMVPMEGFTTEQNSGKDAENHQSDALLNDLELHQREWTSILLKTHAIGWHLKTVFEEGDAPWQ